LILVPEGVSDRSQKETALRDGNEKEEAIGKDTAAEVKVRFVVPDVVKECSPPSYGGPPPPPLTHATPLPPLTQATPSTTNALTSITHLTPNNTADDTSHFAERHFGPIIRDFGFLWRGFVFLVQGRVTAGLEKLGPDPHLDFRAAQRLDPEIDPFLWSLHHREKHHIIQAIIRKGSQKLSGTGTSTKPYDVDNSGKQETLDGGYSGGNGVNGGDSKAVLHGAIVTSGGFIWKIETEVKKKKSTREKKELAKVGEEKAVAEEEATGAAAGVAVENAKKPLMAGISMEWCGVRLTKLGVDPTRNCACSTPKSPIAEVEGNMLKKSTVRKSFESKVKQVDFHHSEKSQKTFLKTGSIFVARKQDPTPQACCYCEDKNKDKDKDKELSKHMAFAESNPNILIRIDDQLVASEHGVSSSNASVSSTERGGGGGGAQRGSGIEGSARGRGGKGAESEFDDGIDGKAEKRDSGGVGGEVVGGGRGGGEAERKEKRDYTKDPIRSFDLRIYLKRYPPPGYKDPEPVLYLVKHIKGVRFPTCVRRVAKEGPAVYDLKKRRITDPKIIWVRRPSVPSSSKEEAKADDCVPEAVEVDKDVAGNKDINKCENKGNDEDDENDENDDYKEDVNNESDVGRNGSLWRANINSWGVKDVCKIECLRNPEKIYRDSLGCVEIIIKFGPAEEISSEAEGNQINWVDENDAMGEGVESDLVGEKWWWWRRDTSKLMEEEELKEKLEKEENRQKEEARKEEEARDQLKELISVRSRDRAPLDERLELPDSRSVRPWWRRKEVLLEETETNDSGLPKKRRWAPGMKFDHQGRLMATFPVSSEERRKSSDWKAPKGLWRRRLETRAAERRHFSASGFHDFGAIGKQEEQILSNTAVASGFFKPKERALLEGRAFN